MSNFKYGQVEIEDISQEAADDIARWVGGSVAFVIFSFGVKTLIESPIVKHVAQCMKKKEFWNNVLDNMGTCNGLIRKRSRTRVPKRIQKQPLV